MDSLKEKIELSIKTYGRPKSRAGTTTKDIASYYKKSALGYRFVHSSIGAMHMKIDGSDSFQADYLSQYIKEGDNVLELGSGNGANIFYLLEKKDANYTGVDLVENQISRANKLTKNRARFISADFNKLPFDNNSFEVVFSVEALCHSLNKEQTLKEISRVLKPGGKLLIFDGWRNKQLTETELEAAEIVERSMAVGLGGSQESWIKTSKRQGLEVLSSEDFSKDILNNTADFNSKARFFLNKKRRFLLKIFPKQLILNGNAALLINELLKSGAYRYGFVGFVKIKESA